MLILCDDDFELMEVSFKIHRHPANQTPKNLLKEFITIKLYTEDELQVS